jgi:hypothetical protein
MSEVPPPPPTTRNHHTRHVPARLGVIGLRRGAVRTRRSAECGEGLVGGELEHEAQPARRTVAHTRGALRAGRCTAMELLIAGWGQQQRVRWRGDMCSGVGERLLLLVGYASCVTPVTAGLLLC